MDEDVLFHCTLQGLADDSMAVDDRVGGAPRVENGLVKGLNVLGFKRLELDSRGFEVGNPSGFHHNGVALIGGGGNGGPDAFDLLFGQKPVSRLFADSSQHSTQVINSHCVLARCAARIGDGQIRRDRVAGDGGAYNLLGEAGVAESKAEYMTAAVAAVVGIGCLYMVPWS